MFNRTTTISKPEEGENPFLLSFSDLMAGLLAVFIVVLIFTLVQLEMRKEELRVSKVELIASLKDIQRVQDKIYTSLQGVSLREQALTELLLGIQSDLKRQGIEVIIAENFKVLRITENELQFGLGQYEIPKAYIPSVKEIGRVLLDALKPKKIRALLDTVFIEGHTDSVPNMQKMGNWGLSTYRAISLWKFWMNTDKLSELKTLQNIPQEQGQASKPLISVSGYADTRSTYGRIDGQEIKKDRLEDRRIDIRFTIASREKKSLLGLQGNLSQMRRKTRALIQSLEGVNGAD